MERGYISLWRCLEEDELWLQEPFTKGQAWVDMILLANYKESSFSVRGNIVHVGRGQLARSERYFQDRWRWSRNKVRAFLSLLEKTQKIVHQKSRIMSIITIVKYDEYQTKEQQKVQQKDHRKTTEGTTYNKVNKVNKIKPLSNGFDQEVYFEKAWELYPKKTGKAAAQKHFNSTVKNKEDFDRIINALKNYSLSVARTDRQYIQSGSTFFYNWQDEEWQTPPPNQFNQQTGGLVY